MQTAPSSLSEGGPSFKGGKGEGVPRSLVVSIHDVSPATRACTEEMLEDLAREGVTVTSLLVIPDHHHRGGVGEDPAFGSWLREQVARGHEAVLHGFHHLRPGRPGEGVVTRLITRSYTAGEGEFYDLSREEASLLLRRGREALRGCGIEPAGFIAPAWLLGAEAEEAVRNEGFEYTTRIASVIDFKSGREFPARSMVYSVRARWRRLASLLWNEALFQWLHCFRKSPLLRIGLHPPDWRHHAIRRHALACIRLAASGREVTTYRSWLAGVRESGPSGPFNPSRNE